MFASLVCCFLFFFFKQKTAYEMRISDWSSDVCSSDLKRPPLFGYQRNGYHRTHASHASARNRGSDTRRLEDPGRQDLKAVYGTVAVSAVALACTSRTGMGIFSPA